MAIGYEILDRKLVVSATAWLWKSGNTRTLLLRVYGTITLKNNLLIAGNVGGEEMDKRKLLISTRTNYKNDF